MAKANTTNHLRLRVLVGSTFVPLFVSEREFEKIKTALKSQKEEWLDIELSGGSTAKIKMSDVSYVECLSETAKVSSDGTIPIKHLADFAGVHPITITRLFAGTLKQVSDGGGKFRRATRETALALRDHLARKNENVPSRRDFIALFERGDS